MAEIEADLTLEDGPLAMRARALLIRVADAPSPAVPDDPAPGRPETADPGSFFPVPYDVGYHTAMEYRFAAGSFLSPGPATCWMRMRVPLVDDEEPSPLTRVLVAADSGNGISVALDLRRFTFVNADLTITLLRRPAGEWFALDARTLAADEGLGLADTRYWDERGVLGRGTQTLLVEPRPE